MLKVQVLAVCAIACLLTGALLGSGVQGYQSAQKPGSQPTPQPTEPPTPQTSPTPSVQQSASPSPSVPALKAVVHTPDLGGANLRAAPNPRGVLKGVLRDETVVSLGTQCGDYISVVANTGETGWIHQATIRGN